MYLRIKGQDWQKGKRAYVVKKAKEGGLWIETPVESLGRFYRKRDAETKFLNWLRVHSDRPDKDGKFEVLEQDFWTWYATDHSQNTVEHAKTHWVHVIREFKGVAISAINAKRVEDYKSKHTLSLPTWKNRLTLLKQYLKYAEAHGFKTSNPFATVKIRQKKIHEYSPKYPSKEDVHALLERMRGKSELSNYLTALCLTYTGMRPIEFGRLTNGDIIDDKFRVFAKNKIRFIPIHEKLRPYLKSLPIQYKHTTFRHALERSCRALGWKRNHITPYSFRHYFATELLRKTKNLKLIAQTMGHTTLEITARYAWVLDEDQREGINLID